MNYTKATFELSDICMDELDRLYLDVRKHDRNIKRRMLVEMAISELCAEHYDCKLSKETQEAQIKGLAEIARDFYSK